MKKLISVLLSVFVLSACDTGKTSEQIVIDPVTLESVVAYSSTTFEGYRLLEIEGNAIDCDGLVNLHENHYRYSTVNEYEYVNKYQFTQCRPFIDKLKELNCNELINEYAKIGSEDNRRSSGFKKDIHPLVCAEEISATADRLNQRNLDDIFMPGAMMNLPDSDIIYNTRDINGVYKPEESIIPGMWIVYIAMETWANPTIVFTSEEKAYEFIERLSLSIK